MTARQNAAKQRRSAIKKRRLFAERLEPRAMLHGGEMQVEDGGPAPAFDGAYYLPPQHRLSNPSGFLSQPEDRDPLSLATSFLSQHAAELGLDREDLQGFRVTDRYKDATSGITHLYLGQTVNGLEVTNANVSISFTAEGEVIFVSSSFVDDTTIAEGIAGQPLVSASQAFMEWSDDVGLGVPTSPEVAQFDSQSPDAATRLTVGDDRLSDVNARLVYVPTEAGLQLAWRMDVHTPNYTHWFDAFVGAESGEPIYTDSLVENASYNVFAWPTQSPVTGTRSVVADPHDTVASPYGWHDTNGVMGAEYTDTRGNNVTAQEDVDHDNAGGFRPDGGASLVFDFPLDTAQDPALYQSAAITNAYYWINLLHDIHYQYGFTEVAGNFQVNNYGRGGLGNDPVIVDVHDGDGGSDSFAALPDGQSPRMSLYKRDTPYRDRAYDSDILIHEFGHGISERLTGGPGNTTALNALQSKGMGEGWSDWWALMLTQVSSDAKLDAYPIGNYAAGFAPDAPGIRQYPYSFDKSIDPLTYGNFNGGAVNNQQHKAGTIWASALWDMNWLLIDKHGFSSDFINGNGGNNLALQLVMDGLKLQGTNPSFLTGRDAILAADRALTGGGNQTEIWTAFARRGMGFSANDGGGAGASAVTEAFDVPGSISGAVYRDDDGSGTKNGGEPGLAGWTVYLDQNNNGIADVPTTNTFTSTPNAPIPESPNTRFTQSVTGITGDITDINVIVNLTHPNVGDLYITLFSPANTPVILSNYLGGSGDNYTNTVFDDEATSYISEGSAPFTGSFKPYFNLSMLDGRDPNGTWTLRFDDRASPNTGTLLSWSLQISSGDVDPVTITDANGDYAFHGLANGTHHVREVSQSGFTKTSPVDGLNDVTIVGGAPMSQQNFGNQAIATVGNGTTPEDTLSSGIVIAPTANQNITHYKISDITSGTMFQNDGITPINNGDFITVAAGQAGIRFLPSLNSNATGKFDVEQSQNGTTVLGTGKATGSIAVTPVNDAPTISDIADLATNEDVSTAALPFIVGDVETAADSLVVTATSSNTTLVPNANITLAGSGANRTIAVMPAANLSGSTTITVTVSDGLISTSDTFVLNVTATNDAPTISDIADLAISEGVSTAALPFIVGDVETAAGSLVVTATSSNTTLVPNANITLAGSGANRTIAVMPAANLSGSTTITVTVSDGLLSTSDTFVLNVTATNDAPTISDIADLATSEDTSTAAMPFIVGDLETAASSLVVTATSSNTTLVPNANIALGGSGANRTIALTPAANLIGSTTITVTVSDGLLSTSDTFVLNVTETNDAPTISDIADLATSEDMSTAALPFIVGDLETAAGSLVVTATSSNTTLVPNANIAIGGSGANRTIALTPAANLIGSTTITVTVSDGLLSSSDTFVLNVNATNDAPTISDIANLATSEDTSTAAMPFIVGDLETAASSLVVTATSSNTTLVPNANIALAGSGANRTIAVTPAANLSGSTTITVTVSDGLLSTSDTFVLNVTATNDAPTISDIADLATSEDMATAALPFIVGDLETAAGSLVVTATSSNTTLIPNTNITLAGSGANRTIAVMPAANLSGSTTITVTVSDGLLSSSDTFVLNVNATNDAPTISDIANLATSEDMSTAAMPFIVGDLETAAGSLVVTATSSNTTLVPNTNITLAGSGANRTIAVTPAANLSGSTTITVTVSDGLISTSDTFVLNVTATNDAPTISDIADLATSEDMSTAALPFIVGDLETAAGSLVVTATSSNTTLVPNANIAIGGSGANRTIAVMPAANLSGLTTITVTVSDGTLSTSDTFLLYVTPTNDAPTISNLPDLATSEGTATAALPFTVGDLETAASSLVVTATSSNTTLVPNANITLAGSGANRTIAVMPAANLSGSTTITVTVSDGLISTSDTFVLTVQAGSSAPPQITSFTSYSTGCAPSFTAPTTVIGTYVDLDSSSHNVTIAWGDGTTSLATVDPVKKRFTATHSYSAPSETTGYGVYTVAATISDGTLQDSASIVVKGMGAYLVDGVVEVIGTAQRDSIVVRPLTSIPTPQFVVEFLVPTATTTTIPPIVFQFALSDVTAIRMELCGGNDTAIVRSLPSLRATIDGGAGADVLTGGSGPAVLIGGEGSDILRAGAGGAVLVGDAGVDYLYGGAGRDVMIGGTGVDYLFGLATDDLLIGGSTVYDHDVPALEAIHAKWREPTPLSVRVAALDVGFVAGSRTLRLKKGVTVLDDGLVDQLFGSAAKNWLLDQ